MLTVLHGLVRQDARMTWDQTTTGKRLKALRGKLSLQAVSDRTGGLISRSRLNNYEQGRRSVDVQTAVVLAKAYRVDPAYILGIPAHIDRDRLESLLVAVDGAAEDLGLPIKPEKKAAIVAYLYEQESAPEKRVIEAMLAV